MIGVVGGIVVALGLWCVTPALAAFPGANGLLAVQPESGGGILLVATNGRLVRRICTARGRCGTPRQPRWSPDGRAIVFAGPAIRIVYADGSCMNCQFGAAPNPAFKPGGTVISFIQRHRLKLDGIDGLRKRKPGIDAATDAVWSASGKVAIDSGGALWVSRSSTACSASAVRRARCASRSARRARSTSPPTRRRARGATRPSTTGWSSSRSRAARSPCAWPRTRTDAR